MRTLFALLLFTLVACAGPRRPAPPRAHSERIVREFTVMGTPLAMEIDARDRASALGASEAALRALEAAEARLSTWRDDTELAAVNALPPRTPLRLSPGLAAELQQAIACSARTGGAFDPTVAPLVAAWGLRQGGRVPDEQALADARAQVGVDRFDLDGRMLTKRAPVTFEEGAFGKGAGLDAARAAATGAGARALTFDLGGQVQHLGDARWIPLAHPDDRARAVTEVLLGDGSLATSGNSERGLLIDGERFGHLLDPREGRPAPAFGSLTVLAPTALAADCLSTGLYVLGPERALTFAQATPGVEVVLLLSHPSGVEIRASSGARLRAVPSRAPPGASPGAPR